MRIGLKPGQWGWRFPELRRAWAATEEAGFASLWCFDHVTAAPAGIPSWEASALLVDMAAVTRRIPVGVMVFNAGLRHPFLLAAALAVAQAASGGRVRVGLGAGSGLAKADHQALGLPFRAFPERVRRLEACCRLLPALWRGETVYDEEVGLHRASLGHIGIQPPPLIVGGRSPGGHPRPGVAAHGPGGPRARRASALRRHLHSGRSSAAARRAPVTPAPGYGP